jgi:hypothetical protein
MKTIKEIIEFINAGDRFFQQQNGAQDSKFKYAFEKVRKRAMRLIERYQEDVEDARIENCATDERGVILRGQDQQYQFTKEGLKAFNAKRRQLLSATPELEPFYSTAPEDLDEGTREACTGFIIKEEKND